MDTVVGSIGLQRSWASRECNGLGFQILGLGFRVSDLRFRVSDLRLRV